MTMSIQNETVVPLRQACRLLPSLRGGGRPHVSTLHRWASRGCRGVRLETVVIGGTRCTSREAMGRFFDALNQMHPGLSDRQIADQLRSEGL